MELDARVRQDAIARRVFSRAGEVYLVGGYLRDLVARGVRSPDMDFAVRGNPGPLAHGVSASLEGTLVALGKEGLLRVVLKGGRVLDFSPLKGSIEEDLRRRDFTANALGWSPGTGLLDPTGGLRDIQRGILRGVARQNFVSDPLRILRAYRFLAEPPWRIERGTRAVLRELASLAGRPAAERITLEFFRLLNGERAQEALRTAYRDRVLQGIVSLPDGQLRRNIQRLSSVAGKVEKIPERYYLKVFPQGLGFPGLHRLEGLFIGAGEHRLSLSRPVQRRLRLVQDNFQRFQKTDFSRKDVLYDLFAEGGEAALDLLVLSCQVEHLAQLRKFWKISAKGLLSSVEVMELGTLKPGPALGRLLYELRKAQFTGEVRTRAQARRWISSRRLTKLR
ncbi:MAG: hypothetical protein P8Y66_00260 [Nitrospirota bacterium]